MGIKIEFCHCGLVLTERYGVKRCKRCGVYQPNMSPYHRKTIGRYSGKSKNEEWARNKEDWK